MADLDLRPLSLGEILDRTFSLYRQNFLLFLGIAVLPQLLVLGLNLTRLSLDKNWRPGLVQTNSGGIWLAITLVTVVVNLVAYAFAQGGTVNAVSDLYLGRSTSIGTSLRRVRGEVANLVGVSLLNGMAILVGLLLLIIPGCYLACRLMTCVPAAVLENLGPRQSLERSFRLTEGNAGRSFLIYLLYIALIYGAIMVFALPFGIMVAVSHRDPGMVRVWAAFSQVGSFFAGVLVTPIFLISTTIFYYDLRVRKEAYDLQLMMRTSGEAGPLTAGVPTMLS